MFSPEFDPLAMLEDLQAQVHQLAVNQQNMAQNFQHLHHTVLRCQEQINHLIHLNQLTNQRLNIVMNDMDNRFKQLNPTSTDSQ